MRMICLFVFHIKEVNKFIKINDVYQSVLVKMKNLTEYLIESNNYDKPIKTTGKHKIKVMDYNTNEYSIYEVNVVYVTGERELSAIIVKHPNKDKFQDLFLNYDDKKTSWMILTSSAENEDPVETWKEYFDEECPEWFTKDKITSEDELKQAFKKVDNGNVEESKNLVEYIKEAMSFGKQLFDEIFKDIEKMKLTQNWNGDCLAVISHKPIDLDAFVTNISANVLPNSKTYKNANGKTKYFGMYNSETKCSTVWVGLSEPITKMYNNLKKDRNIQLTELF